MADTSERIIILAALLLMVIIVQSTQMYQMEPIKENNILTVKDMKTILILEQDSAWVTTTVLNAELSPELEILKISSDDSDIPHSLYKAIDIALEEEFIQEEVTAGGTQRKLHITIIEAESLIHFLGGEIEKDRRYYEFYVGYVSSTFSILIQFHLPDPTS